MAHLNVPLKTALILSGKKQKRIARLVRITETALSQIVRGHRPASDEQRRRLAAFLGKPESELFVGEASA